MPQANFTFTRAPGTKTQVAIVSTSLTSAQNGLVIIGHMAASGSTAPAGVPYIVQNFGDPVAVVAELAAIFGAGSEISSMVVAAINGVLFSDLTTIAYPEITVVPLASGDTSATLDATLSTLLTLEAPFIACCYAGTDSLAVTAILNYVTAISGEDRGRFGQFGSFAFMGIIGSIGTATPIGNSTASENVLFPWRIDTGAFASKVVQDITYTAVAAGTGGNAITIAYVTGGTAGSEVVTVTGNAISVSIAGGVSTAAQILAAIQASTPAKALVSAAITGTASNAQTAVAASNLIGGGVPSYSVQQLCAGTAAVCAANGLPFMPLTDVVVGKAVPPISQGDWITPGDSGTEALGLAAGLIPLMSNLNGTVSISRAVTSSQRVMGTPDADYFDIQDWQVLYYLRMQCYNLAQQPQYKIAKASDATAKALMSDIINTCKIMQDDLNMLQYVDQLLSEFEYNRSATVRSAFTYYVPVNVIPGFFNKGIEVVGTNQFDVLTA